MANAPTTSLPFAIRCFNGLGLGLEKLGIKPVKLTPENLLAEASKRTGLKDYGEDNFRAPYKLLMETLDSEARFSLMGRIIARAETLQLLENRLRLVQAFKDDPSLADQPIRRPIFILGLPRTCTSIMHELMAQDPENRVPMSWEVKYPFPAPELASYHSDLRIAAVEKELSGVDRLMPEFKKMHRMGAELPQECVAITSQDFRSVIFDTQYRAIGYQNWLDHADMKPAYAYHRRFLQHLQSRAPANRWVLKSPGHLWCMDAMLDEYPDADIVQTHRDPLKVLTSVTSLVTTLRTMTSDRVDKGEIAQRQSALLSDALNRTMRVRDSGRLENKQVLDVYFHDFMRDPVAQIDAIYQYFGYQLSDVAAANMQRFLDQHPNDKHGRHSYYFADTGLDEQQERERFAAYQQRFSVTNDSL